MMMLQGWQMLGTKCANRCARSRRRYDLNIADGTPSRVADPHVRLSERPRLPDLPDGRFGRLFPELPCLSVDGNTLLKYRAANGPLECRSELDERAEEGNPRIPAGWAFFGQFIS